MSDKSAHDVVGVVGVADGVGASQEHLEADVGDVFAEFAEALEGVFAQEAHGGVEGGAAPALEAVELGSALGECVGDGELVVGSYARREQGLVGVAHGGVGDEEALLLAGPFGEFFGAVLEEVVAGAWWFGSFWVVGGLDDRQVHDRGGAVFDLVVAVDDDVAEEFQELGGAVAAFGELEECRGGIYESGCGLAGLEDRVVDDVFEEWDVGFDAADAHLAQGAVHALDGQGE